MKNHFLPKEKFEAFKEKFLSDGYRNDGVIVEIDGKRAAFEGILAGRAQEFEKRIHAIDLRQEALVIGHDGNADLELCGEEIAATMTKSGIISHVAAFKGTGQGKIEVLEGIDQMEMIRAAFRSQLIPSNFLKRLAGSAMVVAGSAVVMAIVHVLAGVPAGSIAEVLRSSPFFVNTFLLSVAGIIVFVSTANGKLARDPSVKKLIIDNIQKMQGTSAGNIFTSYIIEQVLALPKPLGCIVLDEQALDPFTAHVLHEAIGENGTRYSGNVMWVVFAGPKAKEKKLLEGFEGTVENARLAAAPRP
jgi:hypothetical protein